MSFSSEPQLQENLTEPNETDGQGILSGTPKLWSILDWSVECHPEFRVVWSFHSITQGYFGLECELHSKSLGVPNALLTNYLEAFEIDVFHY